MGHGMIARLKWKYSQYNRARKMRYFMQFVPSRENTVLDIGCLPVSASRTEDGSNFIEAYFHEQNRQIDALGLDGENFETFKTRYPFCRLITFDGLHFPQCENRYDIALCNAVIEHVGNRELQLEWLKGIRSICKRLIITTPNRYFLLEPHTDSLLLHWFPDTLRRKLLPIFKLPPDNYDELWLLSKGEFCDLLKQAEFKIDRLKCNRFLFNCVDFVAVCS